MKSIRVLTAVGVVIGSTALLSAAPAVAAEPSTAGALRGQPPTPNMAQALPRPLKALRVNPSPVAGGNPVNGTVELVQPPGPNGTTVKLESSNPQLAAVPAQVSVTYGTASAETGPMYTKSFSIATRPVQEDTTVIIRARAGAQMLEVNLRIRRPSMKSASLNAPNICDGSNKGKVSYTLTGPAPSGLKVSVHATVRAPSGQSSSSNESETVSTGKSTGTLRIKLPRCQAHNPGQRCSITGNARVEGPSGYSVFIGGSCGHPPD